MQSKRLSRKYKTWVVSLYKKKNQAFFETTVLTIAYKIHVFFLLFHSLFDNQEKTSSLETH